MSLRAWLSLVAALAVVGGLGYAGWRWVTSPRPSDDPITEQPFHQACSWPRKYFPDAAAYAGARPHPVAIAREMEVNVGDPTWRQMPLTSAPDRRIPRHVNPSDPTKVQLVACVDRTGEGDRIDTCRFDSSSAPVHRAEYTVKLYEAKTGTSVGEETIGDAVEVSCPAAITWDSGDDPKVYAAPSPEQILGAIESIAR